MTTNHTGRLVRFTRTGNVYLAGELSQHNIYPMTMAHEETPQRKQMTMVSEETLAWLIADGMAELLLVEVTL